MDLHQNSQTVKKGAAHAKKSSMKKVVKSKVAANLPELLLLKILPLSDHHSHFWAATFDFTTFFMLLFFAWAASFFTVWLFWCRFHFFL